MADQPDRHVNPARTRAAEDALDWLLDLPRDATPEQIEEAADKIGAEYYRQGIRLVNAEAEAERLRGSTGG